MEKDNIMANNLIDTLETKGEITITDGVKELFIEAVDNKEGYSYVSNTNEEFGSSREAVEWAIKKANNTTIK
ncbi:hypothetical protein [Clostridium sp. YIM B02551]|uniref:hypothetical protein n=1 Tax=Clostridium sp. YIM B02551 TaxID=2910679 RepID=UPI001EECEBEF|nr:hypothetical protein [Clostridium sp. YIM B02551]